MATPERGDSSKRRTTCVSRVVSIALFDMWQNGLFGEVSAIGVVWTLFMTAVSLAFFFLIKKFGMAMR